MDLLLTHALFLLAQGRGEDPDGGAGVLMIIGFILLSAATLAAIAWFVIRRSRRPEHRTGPDEQAQGQRRVGRVQSGVEADRQRR